MKTDLARMYLERRRWKSGPVCPQCGTQRIKPRPGEFYRCNACGIDFSVRTNTVMHRSHVSLAAWLRAMRLVIHDEGITCARLAEELGVTVRTAWLVLRRLREACGTFACTGGIDEMVDRVFTYRP
jgi:transposase-like protein